MPKVLCIARHVNPSYVLPYLTRSSNLSIMARTICCSYDFMQNQSHIKLHVPWNVQFDIPTTGNLIIYVTKYDQVGYNI